MVWRFLGETGRTHQIISQEGVRTNICNSTTSPNINCGDKSNTHVSSNVRNTAHLLCGRRITSLPHEHKENTDDPHYVDNSAVINKLEFLTTLSRWKKHLLKGVSQGL